jgi:uncharacterized protein (TIRG00374 family)
MGKSLKQKIIITIVITAVFYLAGSMWVGWEDITAAMSQFRWWVFPICLALAFLNYLIRFCKWHYYVNILEIPLSVGQSFQVFLSGFAMAATPGKFGEVVKSYLIKEINQTPMSKSAPIVLAERLTDFLAFLILALLGVTLIPNGTAVFIISITLVVVIIVIVSWKSLMEVMIEWAKCLPVIGSKTDHILTAYESTYQLIAPKPLIGATLISIVSWFMECLAFALVMWGFDSAIPVKEATFIYAFGTILGALLMTPGGVGPTEGTLGGLLILLLKVPEGIAASATIIIRICTLWFAVLVGVVVLVLSGRSVKQEELEAAKQAAVN